MRLLKYLLGAGLALGLAGTASAQVASISTPPQGSVWNTMASVIADTVVGSSLNHSRAHPCGGRLRAH